ncbi:GlxA family transcriptional regulator [Pseudonocardia cypriaca]|uniref:AraC family transcriptional regulator with amidase-like domain n=1 Tax=Pseudonocardia cypriaca TaxID=882449 RepID=A0A543FSG7_9PSEU|nr:helix-turn-helix domain-containing protein [Pseudonocardia cypriaca]TQM36694.1 AraC family transcriptional regulator with amidase-like domain [Pseudonocardia cypriaca]
MKAAVPHRAAPHRVAVLALPAVLPFELSIPGRLFRAATDSAGKPLYEVVTCSMDGGPVPTAEDFTVVVRHGPDALRNADTVIVAPVDPASGDERALAAAAAALGEIGSGARIASICTGIDVLAAAGLLDGRRATTHWKHAVEFRRNHPSVRLDPDVLYVDEGAILTSAGAASGIDLCLHIIRADHGAEVASRAARSCVVPPYRDGGQAQFIDHPVPVEPATSTVATRMWALEHLDHPLSLADLARRASMSRRTFTRRFRDEVGLSPNRWLTQQRIELARRLLETTDLPIDQVAARVGIGSASSLRLHLRGALGVPPSAYRRTFRSREERESA